jgi:CubicO group peptidase (beta-lactamase class C family)
MTTWRRRDMLAALAAATATAVRAEPLEQVLGRREAYPVGTAANWFENPYRVGSWSAMNEVPGLRTRDVPRGPVTSELPSARREPEIRWRHRSLGYSLAEYLDRQPVTGLVIAKDAEVLVERYRYGRTGDARFLSFSMAKSVTSLLVGIAQARGLLALDATAGRYAKELEGSAYGDTRIDHLLAMSSGLTFTEHYDRHDDVARMSRAAQTGQPSVVSVLRSISSRHSEPGAKFVYASAETEVLGRALAGATGRTVADLTSDWLWRPLGAERDAFWLLAHDGQERTSGYFNATLRDWARLGILLARDGRMGDRQVVPRDYVLAATSASLQPPAFRPHRATPYMGYGRQFWLFPFEERTFAMEGVHGQCVFVQPASGIVMVQTAVNPVASGRQDPEPGRERDAFWRGVLQSLGGRTA